MPKYTGPEFEHCDRCPSPAGQLVKFCESGEEEALCFTCWNPVKSTCRVLHWVNKYGRLMYAPGATTGPFSIKHP